jgi:hypothetical protein
MEGMAGIVEFECDGMIHRARYWVDGAVVIINYSGKTKQCELRKGGECYALAQWLLRAIVAELHHKDM